MGRQLCTNKAPVVNEQNKPTKGKWKKAREMRENMRSELKKRKEPNQMESMANNCERLERLQLSGLPSLFGTKKV